MICYQSTALEENLLWKFVHQGDLRLLLIEFSHLREKMKQPYFFFTSKLFGCTVRLTEGCVQENVYETDLYVTS